MRANYPAVLLSLFLLGCGNGAPGSAIAQSVSKGPVILECHGTLSSSTTGFAPITEPDKPDTFTFRIDGPAKSVATWDGEAFNELPMGELYVDSNAVTYYSPDATPEQKRDKRQISIQRDTGKVVYETVLDMSSNQDGRVLQSISTMVFRGDCSVVKKPAPSSNKF